MNQEQLSLEEQIELTEKLDEAALLLCDSIEISWAKYENGSSFPGISTEEEIEYEAKRILKRLAIDELFSPLVTSRYHSRAA